MYAAPAGKTEAVARLLEACAEWPPPDHGDFTALDMAANREVLRLLRAASRRTSAAS